MREHDSTIEFQLPLEVNETIDQLCDEFESDVISHVPQMSSFLNRVQPIGRTRLLYELCAMSVEHLKRLGHDDPLNYLRTQNPTLDEELTAVMLCNGFNSEHIGPSAKSGIDELYPGLQFGRFRAVRKLGEGGMGVVYEADDVANGRRVAIKVVRDNAPSQEVRERFLREGQAAARVNHPNSVYVFGTEFVDERMVIVMELAPRGTLADKLRDVQQFGVTEAVDAILDVIAGLEAVYAEGVLHRDVKPANCFVGSDGSVKIGDFGLALTSFSKTNASTGNHKTTAVGTLPFAPPEQIDRKKTDVRSDFYSVGATLFCLLTGEPPFAGKTQDQLKSSVSNDAPSPRLQARRDVPRQLVKTIQRCLAKQPSRRFKSYSELRDALLPFSSAAPAAAPLPYRMMAGLIDFSVLLLVTTIFLDQIITNWSGSYFDLRNVEQVHDLLLVGVASIDPDDHGTWIFLGFGFSVLVSYFALFERWFRATPGKWLLGLRVESSQGGNPSIWQAYIRSLTLHLISDAAVIAAILVFLPSFAEWMRTTDGGVFTGLAITVGTLAICFCTARERNGWRGIHDFLSRTHVVRCRAKRKFRVSSVPNAAVESTQDGPDFGPYKRIRRLSLPGGVNFWVCKDPLLDREVWVIERDASDPDVPPNHRDVARIGRLRWLDGARDERQAWDAYEALPGCPFKAITVTSMSWEHARFLLRDLCVELEHSVRNRMLPMDVSLDHLWVGSDGRLVLIDVSLHTADGCCTETADDASAMQIAREILSNAASALLCEGASGNSDAKHTLPADLPISVRKTFVDLRDSDKSQLPVDQLQKCVFQPARITFVGRLATLLACVGVIGIFVFQDLKIEESKKVLTATQVREKPSLLDVEAKLEIYREQDKPASTKKRNYIIQRIQAILNQPDAGMLSGPGGDRLFGSEGEFFEMIKKRAFPILPTSELLVLENELTPLIENESWTLESFRKHASDDATWDATTRQTVEEHLQKHPSSGKLKGLIETYWHFEAAIIGASSIEVDLHQTCVELLRDGILSSEAGMYLFDHEDQAAIKAIANMSATIPGENHDIGIYFVNEYAERRKQTHEDLMTYLNESLRTSYLEIPTNVILFLAILGAAPSVVSAILFGTSPLLWMLGVSVVTTRGQPARRWRMLVRCLVLWTIVLSGLCTAPYVLRNEILDGSAEIGLTVALTATLVWFIVWTFTSKRGPHDLVTKTMLVPTN